MDDERPPPIFVHALEARRRFLQELLGSSLRVGHHVSAGHRVNDFSATGRVVARLAAPGRNLRRPHLHQRGISLVRPPVLASLDRLSRQAREAATQNQLVRQFSTAHPPPPAPFPPHSTTLPSRSAE